MIRHLIDPAQREVPALRVSKIRQWGTVCGQSVGVLEVVRGIPGQVLCPECEALLAASGADGEI
jgi:hypothetical protein